MGRIKGTLVKRSTKELLKVHPGKFSEDFNQNKITVSGAVPGIPKKIRNSIAGYISRLIHRENKQKK